MTAARDSKVALRDWNRGCDSTSEGLQRREGIGREVSQTLGDREELHFVAKRLHDVKCPGEPGASGAVFE